MKRPLIAAALLAAALGLAAGPPAAEKPMSLQDCILVALKNNLKVAADVLGPEIADAAARSAGEAFLPQMSFTLGTQSTRQASFSWLDAQESVETRFASYQGTLEQRLPWGASLSADLFWYRNETTANFQTINPRYGSRLSFEFAQPLLRDFGFRVSRRAIIVARNNQEISENTLRQTLTDTVFDVEQAYWNLVYAQENLKVRRESLKLASDLLAKNTRELEVGTIPPIDLLSARAEVATREADILQAEAAVKNAQDTLRTLLNLPRETGGPRTAIVPAELPQTVPFQVNLEEAQSRSLTHRPELATAQVNIRTSRLNLGYARNQTLPNLSVQAQFWSPGVSGTQILYQDDNPLTGVIIGTIPGGPSLAFKDAFRFSYKNWFVGLTFQLPVGSVVSRAQVAQARLESRQARLDYEDQEQQILLEVETALRAVETDYKRSQAYQLARGLAEEKLAAEEKRLRAGLSTNYTVLQQQRDLAQARTNEIQARVDYNMSLARLQRAMGTTLESKDISLAELPSR